jgi:hypothetical protein
MCEDLLIGHGIKGTRHRIDVVRLGLLSGHDHISHGLTDYTDRVLALRVVRQHIPRRDAVRLLAILILTYNYMFPK